MASALVQVRDLVKRFGATRALNGITVALEAGGPIGLVGRNGAGKTTFLSVLAGAFPADAGFVELCGAPPGDRRLSGRIGVLMQDAHFKRGIPVIRQLRHLGRLGGLSRPESGRQALDLLRRLGDVAYSNRTPEQLSYGQRKRAGIAQALLGKPDMVLLDEPTAGLDPVAAGSVRELIRERSSASTFIISSHNLYEIQDICSRVLIIDGGQIIFDTEMSTLTDDERALTVTLNRAASQTLLDALTRLSHVRELRCERNRPARVELLIATDDADSLQIEVQALINNQGYSVVALNRGGELSERIMSLLGKEPGTASDKS